MRMDASHYLATESFSYSWLPTTLDVQHHPKPSKTPSNNPTLFPNQHQQEEEEANFNGNFDFDISKYSLNSSIVHADKLFSNGRLVVPPSSLNHPYSKARREKISYGVTSPGSVALFPSPSNYQSHVSKNGHNSAGKYNYLKGIFHNFTPRRMLSKYIRCFIPAGNSRGRNGIRVDDVNRRAWEVRSSYNNTPEASISPRRREQIDESSIYEAIVYCKRSSGSSN